MEKKISPCDCPRLMQSSGVSLTCWCPADAGRQESKAELPMTRWGGSEVSGSRFFEQVSHSILSGMRLELSGLFVLSISLVAHQPDNSKLTISHLSLNQLEFLVHNSEVGKSIKTQHSRCLSSSFQRFLFHPPQTVT